MKPFLSFYAIGHGYLLVGGNHDIFLLSFFDEHTYRLLSYWERGSSHFFPGTINLKMLAHFILVKSIK